MPKNKTESFSHTAPDASPVKTRITITAEAVDWTVTVETELPSAKVLVGTLTPSSFTAGQRTKITNILQEAYDKILDVSGFA